MDSNKTGAVDWNVIKAEYIAGGTSYRKLCAKYDVSRTTLQRKAKDENWLGLRSQAEAKTETRIVNTVSTKNAKVDDKYFRLVDKLLAKAEGVIDNMPTWQPSNLKEMATALKYIKECRGVKSEIDLREQDARIRSLEKQLDKDNDALTEIEVVFKDGEEEWNE